MAIVSIRLAADRRRRQGAFEGITPRNARSDLLFGDGVRQQPELQRIYRGQRA
ncbi:MAG: hypothetical protein IAE88_07680 [Rhodobacteraceae bacterium]|nr:hypothetical protein [Paracoccaceae bacterium]